MRVTLSVVRGYSRTCRPKKSCKFSEIEVVTKLLHSKANIQSLLRTAGTRFAIYMTRGALLRTCFVGWVRSF